MQQMLCLLIGYGCGCFLTAEVVARFAAGRSAAELGSGNPGMANIGSQLGLKWGAVVLAGDVLKTALACFLCGLVLFPGLGRLAVLWAGLGTVLGHNFPVWKKFKGGKGVAVTCAVLVFASPLWGVLSGLVGLAAVCLTGYLPLGAVLIPVVFLLPAFCFLGAECGWVALLLAVLMLSRHIHGLKRMVAGEEHRVGPRGRG